MFERILRFCARFDPDGVAISTPVGEASFATLDRDVDRMAQRLRALTPERGFVAVQAANPGLHWVVLLALARLGCATASLPTVGERPEAELISILAPDLVVTDRETPDAPTASFHMSKAWIAETFETPSPPVREHVFGPDEPVRVVLSSGSTGRPKKMVLSRAVMDARVRGGGVSLLSAKRLQIGLGLDTEIGFRAGFVAWATRRPVLYPEAGFNWPDHLLKARPESLMLVPIQLDALLRSLPPGFPRQFMDVVVVSGAVSQRLYEETVARLSPKVFVTYGSTEAGYVATSSPFAGSRTASLVNFQAEVEIVDEADRAAPTGQQGRIRVRTAEMVQGYVDDADTERHFRDGWFYPGDLGSLDADGALSVTGRESEIFDIGGLRIAPSAIEEVLLACEGVRDAAAFAVRRDAMDWPHAAVVCEPGCDLDAVRSRLRTERPQLSVPLVRVAQIPYSDRGKVDRAALSRNFAAAPAPEAVPVPALAG